MTSPGPHRFAGYSTATRIDCLYTSMTIARARSWRLVRCGTGRGRSVPLLPVVIYNESFMRALHLVRPIPTFVLLIWCPVLQFGTIWQSRFVIDLFRAACLARRSSTSWKSEVNCAGPSIQYALRAGHNWLLIYLLRGRPQPLTTADGCHPFSVLPGGSLTLYRSRSLP
jgi:hypothetical protein